MAGLDSTPVTVNSRAVIAATAESAAACVAMSNLSRRAPSRLTRRASNVSPRGVASRRLHGPVFAGAERLDLHLALDDQPQGDGLDAAGGLRARQLAPEHGGEAEADEIVERAAGEIGFDQFHVDLPRMVHRGRDGGFGDGVKDDALDLGGFLHRLALGQGLQQVPGDRLALAVGVGGEDQFVVAFQSVGDGADMLLAVGSDLPEHLEFMVGIDRAVLGRQVAHMAIGGEHGETGAEILVDGLRLGGRFDNDDGHGLLPRRRGRRLSAA